MSAPVLIIERASKIYGSGEATIHALSKVSVEVSAGELVAVMGPSGSGKSTLLNLAGALEQPSAGRVLIGGQDITTMSANALAAVRRRRVGFVFQDFNLLPTLTALENVALPLELDGVPLRKARELAAQSLEAVRLPGVAGRLPGEMSGGQRQRVAIARALVGSRQLVLADEPTGALDTQSADGVLEILRTQCDEGAAGLMVTHDARLAGWADRIVFLRDGCLVETTDRAITADDLVEARP